MTARLASNLSNSQGGTFTAVGTLDQVVTAAPVQFVQTTSGGTQQGVSGSATYLMDWAPPASNVGNITFYVAGLAANGSGTGGDHVYTSNVTITPAVVSTPTMTVAPPSLAFTYVLGGPAPVAQNVAISSSGTNFTATAAVGGGTWLSASPATGTTPRTVSVSINTAGLVVGVLNGTLTITAAGASNSPQTVPVRLTVSPALTPTLTVNPLTLNYAYQIGGALPAAQIVSVASSGANVAFTAVGAGGAWLAASPASATSPAAVTVSVITTGLGAGIYNGTLTIAAAGVSNSPQTVAVRLTVTQVTTPTLTLSPAALSYAYQIGGAVPVAQNVSVGSSGANVAFTAAVAGGTWLSASPASATTPAAVSVSVNTAGLAAGTYNGTLTVAAAGVSNSPQTVAVALSVTTATVTPGQFKYNIVRVEQTRRGQFPRVTFSVTDPSDDDARYDITTHPAFTQIASGASRLFVQVGWDTRDFTNTGSKSEVGAPGTAAAALPIAINALAAPVANGNGTYTVTSPLPIPASAQGSGQAAMEGHPAGQDAVGAWTVRVPVRSVFRSFIITGEDRVERRRVVDVKNCKSCHGVLTLHGNNRTDEPLVCVMCHNPNATDVPFRLSTDGPETPLDFKRMVHSIHSAQMRTTPFVIIGRSHSINDFSTVVFPGELRNCRTCHREGTFQVPQANRLGTTVDTRSTLTLGAPIVNGDPSDDLKITPAAAVCSSCHDSTGARDHMVRNGASFSTLQQAITSGAVRERCGNCHGKDRSQDVERVHRVER